MSIVVNPIKYTLFGSIVPKDKLPIVEIAQDSAAYGTIDLNIPTLTTITSVACSVYRTAPPTTAEARWARLLPDLWTDSICHFTYTMLSTGLYRITWEFDPDTITGIGTDEFYSKLRRIGNSHGNSILIQHEPETEAHRREGILNYTLWQ